MSAINEFQNPDRAKLRGVARLGMDRALLRNLFALQESLLRCSIKLTRRGEARMRGREEEEVKVFPWMQGRARAMSSDPLAFPSPPTRPPSRSPEPPCPLVKSGAAPCLLPARLMPRSLRGSAVGPSASAAAHDRLAPPDVWGLHRA